MTCTPQFAYGSLLSAGVMLDRAPTAERVGPAVLDGWRLTFRHGAADVTPEPGRRVLGGVWVVTDEDLDELDRYEGISVGSYCRYPLPVMTLHGEVWADTYVMPSHPDTTPEPVSEWYLRVVASGLCQFGHSLEELQRAVREATA